MEKWDYGKFEQAFSSLIDIFFAIFDDFSKESITKALRNFEKSANMRKNLAKNEAKTCSTCFLSPFFG